MAQKAVADPVAMPTFAPGHFFQSSLICSGDRVLPHFVPENFSDLCDCFVAGFTGNTSNPRLA